MLPHNPLETRLLSASFGYLKRFVFLCANCSEMCHGKCKFVVGQFKNSYVVVRNRIPSAVICNVMELRGSKPTPERFCANRIEFHAHVSCVRVILVNGCSPCIISIFFQILVQSRLTEGIQIRSLEFILPTTVNKHSFRSSFK